MLINLIFENPLMGLLVFGAIVVALSVHEFAHAWSADRLGDKTPRSDGRITLDPRSHLDPIGTIFLLLVGFGWGKPVVFNPFNLKNPRRDTAIIAFAGPLSNVLLAVSAILLLAAFDLLGGGLSRQVLNGFEIFITINFLLAVFNMVPIDPLDGFKVVAGLLPHHLSLKWQETQKYGLIVLLILLITGFISNIVMPIVRIMTIYTFDIIYRIFSLI